MQKPMKSDIREHSENPRLLVKWAGSSATLATDYAVKQLSRDPLASIRIVSEEFWYPVISVCVHTTPAKTIINWKIKFVLLFIQFFDLGCYRKNPQKNNVEKVGILNFSKCPGSLPNSSWALRTSPIDLALAGKKKILLVYTWAELL